MVHPDNTKPIKTMSRYNPAKSKLDRRVLEEFIQHQEDLMELGKLAQNANLSKNTVPVEFFKLIRMKTGDTLLFMMAHQERHIQQALRVLKDLPKTNQLQEKVPQ